jgi:ABC-type multidrug transport system permease subunit
MTATSIRPVSPADVLVHAPGPTPTLARTFAAMMAREIRVLRRKLRSTVSRVVMQPLLFVFVFTYVLPKTDSGLTAGHGDTTFATILVPGLVASTLLIQGILSVSIPLIAELSWERTIEDRVLAPVRIWVLAVQKITAGAAQALIGALMVFPIVLLVHGSGQAPRVHIADWPLLILVLLASALFFASIGLLLATVMDPRHMQVIFTTIVLPITMLGCVYYPWTAMHTIRWLQFAVLVNPMVYVAEGLRATLTAVPHMPDWAFLLVILGGTLLVGGLAVISFGRRILD